MELTQADFSDVLEACIYHHQKYGSMHLGGVVLLTPQSEEDLHEPTYVAEWTDHHSVPRISWYTLRLQLLRFAPRHSGQIIDELQERHPEAVTNGGILFNAALEYIVNHHIDDLQFPD